MSSERRRLLRCAYVGYVWNTKRRVLQKRCYSCTRCVYPSAHFLCADTALNRTTKSRRGGDRRTRERDLKEIRSCRRTKGRLSEKERERQINRPTYRQRHRHK